MVQRGNTIFQPRVRPLLAQQLHDLGVQQTRLTPIAFEHTEHLESCDGEYPRSKITARLVRLSLLTSREKGFLDNVIDQAPPRNHTIDKAPQWQDVPDEILLHVL